MPGHELSNKLHSFRIFVFETADAGPLKAQEYMRWSKAQIGDFSPPATIAMVDHDSEEKIDDKQLPKTILSWERKLPQYLICEAHATVGVEKYNIVSGIVIQNYVPQTWPPPK